MWRHVFAYAMNPEVYLDADNIRSLLPKDLPEEVSCDLPLGERLGALRIRAEDLAARWRDLFDTLDAEREREAEAAILEQTAPLASAFGAALQGLSAPCVFEDPVNLRLMALLADDIGVGAPERSRFDRFRDICRAYEVTSVAGSIAQLSDTREIRDGMFRLPATIFAMSRRSDVFDCELIGLDLAWRHVGLLPVWGDLRLDGKRRRALDVSLATSIDLVQGQTANALALEIGEEIAGDRVRRARLCHGISIFAVLMEEMDALARAIVRSISDPRLAMAILVQDRAREARVYHSAFKLEGRPLSDWFAQSQDDPMPLVDALGRSRLIRPGQPERSQLINGLLRPDGAMFRIFSQADIAIIARWITSLAQEGERERAAETVLPKAVRLSPGRQPVAAGDLEIGARPGDIRTAYFLLQGRALAPRTRQFALDYCAFWLDLARRSVDRSDRSLPGDWRPGELREWLQTSHDAHGRAFEEARDQEFPSRESVIEQTVQLAPLTLIDGAWLQGFTDVSMASSRFGAPLFETYWDELGNGDWQINHPKIYRDVLAAMAVTLPPTGSRAFAEDRRIDDGSYRLPVYWLAIGKFPVTFRPEILGLNLAMELSGVGGSYRNAREFLKHHGFPTIFVDLHNTIDNVSSGHSAWAADAIDAYVQSSRDVVPVAESWARIRAGYESLAPLVDDPRELDFFARTSAGKPGRGAAPPGTIDTFHHHPLRETETAS
ncbi:heme oxygenase-like protein [Breoghania corrubedonensis]|uniref:Heme oxygenase-like protein n=1 Tax=Breoghania corrubedonensis TaxID=665038 RepID=A0A2T5VA37_9HYPH|nr:iron-containing redox enzyme family protein [Breoghania corrubedonensis]PTW60618.1 heme oxygenase-like protein [Breoghania corrubedonensis]